MITTRSITLLLTLVFCVLVSSCFEKESDENNLIVYLASVDQLSEFHLYLQNINSDVPVKLSRNLPNGYTITDFKIGPSNDYITYRSRDSRFSKQELNLVPVNDPNPIRISPDLNNLNSVGGVDEFYWSADGDTIAFTGAFDGDDVPNLYIYTISTGTLQRPLPGQWVSKIRWSPNQNELLVTSSGTSDLYQVSIQHISLAQGLASINTITLSQLELAADKQWSPMGDKFVYWSYDRTNDDCEIMLVSIQDFMSLQLTPPDRFCVSDTAHWSGDGNQIYVTGDFDSPSINEVFEIDINSISLQKISRPLSPTEFIPIGLSVSPDSKNLVYTIVDDTGHHELNLYGTDDNTTKNLNLFDLSASASPLGSFWSEDNSRLTFYENDLSGTHHVIGYYEFDTETLNEIILPTNEPLKPGLPPLWESDYSTIYFPAYLNNVAYIYRYDLNSNDLIRITHEPNAPNASVVFDPDKLRFQYSILPNENKSVYLATFDSNFIQELYVNDLDSDSPRKLNPELAGGGYVKSYEIIQNSSINSCNATNAHKC